MNSWMYKSKIGILTIKETTPQNALTLADEIKKLKQENAELKCINEILSKATAFFAQSKKK